jgi:micrococcal nuclease
VIDGDTIEIRINKRSEVVRLIGIDTPETVLPEGTDVHVVRDQEGRDYYGRLLLYVFRASDNLFVNQHMVETGHAVPYPFEPNTAYARTFAASGHTARASNLGLWGTCPR